MRSRFLNMFLATSIAIASGAALDVAGSPAPAGAAAAPQCTFNGSSLPIVTNVSAGKTVVIHCTGLPALHPFLLAEASLVIGIDPQTKALLSGSSGLSPALFLAALEASKEINPGSVALPTSDLDGNLDYTWKVPSTQPLDPNASCPPSTKEFNSGLLGCALAMIDLTTQKPVGAGSAVLEFAGFPLLPPQPTIALSRMKARPGQIVAVADAPGATRYWWAATLAALEALLGGAPSPATVKVTVGSGTGARVALSDIHVAPATYKSPLFTPPIISGTFRVPTHLKGLQPVTVTMIQPLLGLPVVNTAATQLKV